MLIANVRGLLAIWRDVNRNPLPALSSRRNPPGADPGTLTREKCDYRERPLHDKHFVENTSCLLQFGSTITIRLQRWVFSKAELVSPSYSYMYLQKCVISHSVNVWLSINEPSGKNSKLTNVRDALTTSIFDL